MAVNLVDVSNVVHVGHWRMPDASITDVNNKQIYTGGMFNLLRLLTLRKYNSLDDLWIFCFDRRTTRKEEASMLGIDYKGGRDNTPPEIILQLDQAEKWLRKSGFNVYAFEGYEADDIIATLGLSLKTMGVEVNVISSDRDHCFLVDDNISIISPNSRVASVYKRNYKDVAGKRGHRVHYNTSLLYKVLCGDNSDKIPSVKRNAYALYNQLTLNLHEHGVDYESLADFDVVESIVNLLEGEIGERARNNWKLIRPKIVPEEWMEFKPFELNVEEFGNMLSLFEMKTIARTLRIPINNSLPDFNMKGKLELSSIYVDILHRGYSALERNEDEEPGTYQPYDDGEEQDPVEQIKDIQATNELINDTFSKFTKKEDQEVVLGEEKEETTSTELVSVGASSKEGQSISDDFREVD